MHSQGILGTILLYKEDEECLTFRGSVLTIEAKAYYRDIHP